MDILPITRFSDPVHVIRGGSAGGTIGGTRDEVVVLRDSLVTGPSDADPILKAAADDAIQGVEEGSFYRRVLGPLKEQNSVPAELVSGVNQVRDFRNWAAHERRGRPKNNVTPEDAF